MTTNSTEINQTSSARTGSACDVARDELERPEWLPSDRWPFALRRYRHDRPGGAEPLTIHYTDEGAGPTLVFVHAGMWSFIWRDAIAALRSDFRCITLDFPGSGLSDGSGDDVDLSTYPAIINGLLDHCGVGQTTIVVHDLGGAVGIAAAGQRPDRVNGLVITNSFAWAPQERALKIMLGVMGSRATTGLLGTFRVLPRMTRTAMGVGRHYQADDRAAFFGPYRRRDYARNFHRAMRSAGHSPALFDLAEEALTTDLNRVPTLTVFGEKNDQFGFTDRWRSMMANTTAWTVEGGNHFPMCDDPDGYADKLRDWHRSKIPVVD